MTKGIKTGTIILGTGLAMAGFFSGAATDDDNQDAAKMREQIHAGIVPLNLQNARSLVPEYAPRIADLKHVWELPDKGKFVEVLKSYNAGNPDDLTAVVGTVKREAIEVRDPTLVAYIDTYCPSLKTTQMAAGDISITYSPTDLINSGATHYDGDQNVVVVNPWDDDLKKQLQTSLKLLAQHIQSQSGGYTDKASQGRINTASTNGSISKG